MGLQQFFWPSVLRLGVASFVLVTLEGTIAGSVSAQTDAVTLATGFNPDPTVLNGIGGGDRSAAEVVKTRQTPTGPCLGYISSRPHEEVTLQNRFSNLEMRVESEADTTLIIEGPGGIWCNDDSQGKNPAIAGDWLPGQYRVWIGSYQAGEVPEYTLYLSDRS